MFDFDLETLLYKVPAILIGMSFHEFAHAFASDRLGDPTPRSQGRLTLSPLPHIDIIGFILLMFAGFGWAKPVIIDPRYYKKPRRDDIIVSAAGPAMNLLLAVLFALLIKGLMLLFGSNIVLSNNILNIIINLFLVTIQVNVILMIFNLLPLPPLDGFHILANIIPANRYKLIYTLEQYSTIIFILIIVTPVVGYILMPPLKFIMGLLMNLAGLSGLF